MGFRGVPEAVWNFHIGGYRVCEKWLKDRKGRTLSKDDIANYQKIVVALSETIRLMADVDVVIEQYGGWPTAFMFEMASAEKSTRSELKEVVRAVPLRSTLPAAAYQEELLPLQKVAEPRAPQYEAAEITDVERSLGAPSQLDREDLVCGIRQLLGDGVGRSRNAAVDEMARDLGCDTSDAHIRVEIDSAFRAASRRGIVTNEGGVMRLSARTIDQYERAFLKDQFLGSLPGRQWIERDQSIRAFARWMGFRRTGDTIDEITRSLINGLLREARLEREGSRIRRSG
jgi:hypothetical protein